jgi:phosphotriesterase-related protein
MLRGALDLSSESDAAVADTERAVVVRTVTGDVAPSELGIVLPHEHALIDIRRFFLEPTGTVDRAIAHADITLENLGWVRYHHRQSRDNLILSDVATLIHELQRFKAAGGGTVVELTPACAGRDVAGLIAISRATGLHVVAGTGVYLDEFHTEATRVMSARQVGERMVDELTIGIDGGTVPAGIIGEMGCSWPLTQDEEKALRGAAYASVVTGASISIHPGRHPDAPAALLDVLISEGAHLDRVVICHLDRTIPDHEGLVTLGRSGCFLEFDLFGQESSYIRYGPVDLPNDATRIRRIAELVDAGFEDQILLSQDIAVKDRLNRYGGHGYEHLLERVVPRMREHGIRDDAIRKMLIDNPARMLAWAPPSAS